MVGKPGFEPGFRKATPRFAHHYPALTRPFHEEAMTLYDEYEVAG